MVHRPSQLGQQLRLNSSQIFFLGRLLWPPDDEALLVRLGRLGDNMEVDVVHDLCARTANTNTNIIGSARRTGPMHQLNYPLSHLMSDASIILFGITNGLEIPASKR